MFLSEELSMKGFSASSKKTGTDVHYEITPRTQQSISRWIFAASLEASSFLFPSSRRFGQPISYSFYRSIIRNWAVKLGLNADYYGTHSMRRSKATLIYARTKNIRAEFKVTTFLNS
jgi:site-specific recombinase XerC